MAEMGDIFAVWRHAPVLNRPLLAVGAFSVSSQLVSHIKHNTELFLLSSDEVPAWRGQLVDAAAAAELLSQRRHGCHISEVWFDSVHHQLFTVFVFSFFSLTAANHRRKMKSTKVSFRPPAMYSLKHGLQGWEWFDLVRFQ